MSDPGLCDWLRYNHGKKGKNTHVILRQLIRGARGPALVTASRTLPGWLGTSFKAVSTAVRYQLFSWLAAVPGKEG